MIYPLKGLSERQSKFEEPTYCFFFRSCDLDFFVNVSGRSFIGDKDLGSFCDYEKLHFHNYYKK